VLDDDRSRRGTLRPGTGAGHHGASRRAAPGRARAGFTGAAQRWVAATAMAIDDDSLEADDPIDWTIAESPRAPRPSRCRWSSARWPRARDARSKSRCASIRRAHPQPPARLKVRQ
jgi:hypothetical protein